MCKEFLPAKNSKVLASRKMVTGFGHFVTVFVRTHSSFLNFLCIPDVCMSDLRKLGGYSGTSSI
jgi:hypothetical protein